jgi:hypothetical protein
MRARRVAGSEAARDQRSARKRGTNRQRVSDAPPANSETARDASARTRASTPKRKRKHRR